MEYLGILGALALLIWLALRGIDMKQQGWEQGSER